MKTIALALVIFSLSSAVGAQTVHELREELATMEKQMEAVNSKMAPLMEEVLVEKAHYLTTKTDEAYDTFSATQVELGLMRDRKDRLKRRIDRLHDKIVGMTISVQASATTASGNQ